MSAAESRTRAIVRYVERRGGRVTVDRLDQTFIFERGYVPELYCRARSRAVEGGLLGYDGQHFWRQGR